jgi:hypothetical protein
VAESAIFEITEAEVGITERRWPNLRFTKLQRPKSELRNDGGRICNLRNYGGRKSEIRKIRRAEIVIPEIHGKTGRNRNSRNPTGRIRKSQEEGKSSRILIWEGGRLLNLAEGKKLTNPNLGSRATPKFS